MVIDHKQLNSMTHLLRFSKIWIQCRCEFIDNQTNQFWVLNLCEITLHAYGYCLKLWKEPFNFNKWQIVLIIVEYLLLLITFYMCATHMHDLYSKLK